MPKKRNHYFREDSNPQAILTKINSQIKSIPKNYLKMLRFKSKNK